MALSPSTFPSPNRFPPSTTSSISCSKGMLCQRPLPRGPTRLRQRVTLWGLSSCSSMALPRAQAVERPSSPPS